MVVEHLTLQKYDAVYHLASRQLLRAYVHVVIYQCLNKSCTAMWKAGSRTGDALLGQEIWHKDGSLGPVARAGVLSGAQSDSAPVISILLVDLQFLRNWLPGYDLVRALLCYDV